jgi:hypothetical protein
MMELNVLDFTFGRKTLRTFDVRRIEIDPAKPPARMCRG